ncbi:MAG: DUF4203 domain-containing protein [Candidatus Aegiribacteria sp.]|nr:DUF4203 domain-containing protein [Candidatus Aegiribacteria sp.]MBD3294545.1 DUF4203 domain-containing protein [Candidatus Fermentibacteria bacterium]
MNNILSANVFTFPFISFFVGLLFCFLGRKLLGFIVVLFGFLIGYTWLTALFCGLFDTTVAQSGWIPWVAGLLGAAIGLVAWKVSVFLAGAVMGLFLARGLLPASPQLLHGGIAIVSGILAHIYREPLLSLLTAVSGAYIAAGSAVVLLEDLGMLDVLSDYADPSTTSLVIGAVLTLVFSVVGFNFQSRNTNG